MGEGQGGVPLLALTSRSVTRLCHVVEASSGRGRRAGLSSVYLRSVCTQTAGQREPGVAPGLGCSDPDAAVAEPECRAAAAPASRPSPAGPASPFSLGRSLRCRMDRAPPPLLCSVIQTWKVNNTLTSSGVCVLLHGYFPEYLALSKRGALRLGPGRRAGWPREGRLPPRQDFFPVGSIFRTPIRNRLGAFAALKTDHFRYAYRLHFGLGCAYKSFLSDLYFYQRHSFGL